MVDEEHGSEGFDFYTYGKYAGWASVACKLVYMIVNMEY